MEVTGTSTQYANTVIGWIEVALFPGLSVVRVFGVFGWVMGDG